MRWRLLPSVADGVVSTAPTSLRSSPSVFPRLRFPATLTASCSSRRLRLPQRLSRRQPDVSANYCSSVAAVVKCFISRSCTSYFFPLPDESSLIVDVMRVRSPTPTNDVYDYCDEFALRHGLSSNTSTPAIDYASYPFAR